MALLAQGVIRRLAPLRTALTRLTSSSPMHDPLEHVTGIEKRELLAHLAGDCDPFRILSIKKGKLCIIITMMCENLSGAKIVGMRSQSVAKLWCNNLCFILKTRP